MLVLKNSGGHGTDLAWRNIHYSYDIIVLRQACLCGHSLHQSSFFPLIEWMLRIIEVWRRSYLSLNTTIV